MILSDFPNCSPYTNTASTINCEFDENKLILTVLNLVESEVPGGSIIEFDVDSFRNPYSGKPRDGFWVKTTDAAGGEMDSSIKAGLVISFKVTEFTDFQTLALSRVDT
jgi:hypothetical protein